MKISSIVYFLIVLSFLAIIIGATYDGLKTTYSAADFCEIENNGQFETGKFSCLVEEDKEIIEYKVNKFKNEWRLVK